MAAIAQQHTAELLELIHGARRKQMEIAQHGAKLILAAISASGRMPITKRQAQEIPNLRRLASKYPGRAVPIAVLLSRFEAQRVLPGIVYKGLARWEIRDDGPYLVVKEVGEE